MIPLSLLAEFACASWNCHIMELPCLYYSIQMKIRPGENLRLSRKSPGDYPVMLFLSMCASWRWTDDWATTNGEQSQRFHPPVNQLYILMMAYTGTWAPMVTPWMDSMTPKILWSSPAAATDGPAFRLCQSVPRLSPGCAVLVSAPVPASHSPLPTAQSPKRR